MSEMVERVARAIFEADIASTQKEFPGAPPNILRVAAEALFNEHHIPMARAAIEAMREPNDTMMAAVGQTALQGRIWSLMIDAALNEEG